VGVWQSHEHPGRPAGSRRDGQPKQAAKQDPISKLKRRVFFERVLVPLHNGWRTFLPPDRRSSGAVAVRLGRGSAASLLPDFAILEILTAANSRH